MKDQDKTKHSGTIEPNLSGDIKIDIDEVEEPGTYHTSTMGSTDESNDKVKKEARDLTEHAKEMKEQSKHEAKHFMHAELHRVADSVERVGNALKHSTDELRRDNPDNIVAEYTDYVVQRVFDASNYIRHHSVNEMVNEGRRLAREHPTMFLGALFLAGVGVSRMLRAARDESESGSSEIDETSSSNLDRDEPAPIEGGSDANVAQVYVSR